MGRARSWSLVAVAGLVTPAVLGALPAQAASAAKPYDFDGDGRPDTVVGAPYLDRGSIDAAGGVVVVDGESGDDRIITQSSSKVAGGSEDGDHFGSAVASADFDRDGYADLAVGLPGEDFSGKDDAGAVTILYGTSKGLSGTRSRQISEPSGKEEFAGFGAALAVGDLDGDGYPDLAVGAPADDDEDGSREDYPATGTVTVLRGGPDGIRTSGSRVLRGVRGTTEQDYHFGSSLAVGEVDGGGAADLVVLAEGHVDDDDGGAFRGSASFCSGGTGGPSTCHRLARSSDLQNNNAVAVGNVQGDARAEIVVGVPTSSIISDPGHVEVLTLSGSGATTSAQATRLGQADFGLPGASTPDEEDVDDFGASLDLGRVDGDAYDDLVVGAPAGSVGDERAGRVFLVHGGAGGLASSGNRAYDQDTPGVPGGSEDGDRFGGAVSLLDRDGDGKADLTIGAPGEDDDGGRVTTLLGSGDAFTTTGARAFGLREVDVNYDNRYDARFGAVLGQ